MNTKRAYKERFYPTPEQARLLARSFGCARFVYNDTLRFRTDAYYKDGNSISHSQAEKRLVSLKSEYPFLKDVSSVILQQTLRDQQEAFKNFWAGRAKYPKFKKWLFTTKTVWKQQAGTLYPCCASLDAGQSCRVRGNCPASNGSLLDGSQHQSGCRALGKQLRKDCGSAFWNAGSSREYAAVCS